MKVLEIGPGLNPKAKILPIFKDWEIVTLDINPEVKPDIVADAGHIPPELHGQFDAVFSSHVLEHFPHQYTKTALKGWIDCLNDDGKIFLVLPAFEWAARQAFMEEPSRATMFWLFGGQANEFDYHMTAFTMRRLRALLEGLGMYVLQARSSPVKFLVGTEEFDAEEHYISASKSRPPLAKA